MHVQGAAGPPNQSASVAQPRLVQAAHEFEAQMMKELLKPMTRAASMDGDESDSGSGGALADFATESLGESLSRSGGLGIATSILRSLSRHDTTPQQSPDPGALKRRIE
jgi:Rod binding domain-containing protein